MKENTYLVTDVFYSHFLHKNYFPEQKNSYVQSVFHILLQSQGLGSLSHPHTYTLSLLHDCNERLSSKRAILCT